MSSSLPDGFSVRPLSPDDARAVNDLIVAADVAAHGETESDVESLLDWWRMIDLDRASWLFEQDGRAVAYAVALVRGELFDAEGRVHPDFTGRGLGSTILELTERHARELGVPRIHNGCLASDAAARRLLEDAGYRDVRRFYRMRIDLDGPPPEPEWPDGLVVDTFRPEDARGFHAATVEAFEDEWNFHPTPFEEWKEFRLNAPDFDPSLWFLVRDGDEVAAIIRCERRFGAGWVGALAVRKPWRRRGLGIALLRHAFREFHRLGERRVALGVDAENATGATRLYERAGMYVAWEAISYGKDLG